MVLVKYGLSIIAAATLMVGCGGMNADLNDVDTQAQAALDDDDDSDSDVEHVITGSGEGGFGVDIDDDGDLDGSYFSISVEADEDGNASGMFHCYMFGKWDFIDNTRVRMMQGNIHTVDVDDDGGAATLYGDGFFGEGPKDTTFPFVVEVTAGGAGEATYDVDVSFLLQETVSVGSIAIHEVD